MIRTFNILILICFIAILTNCNEDKDPAPASISLQKGGIYTDSDLTVSTGDQVHIKFEAIAGDGAITNLIITMTTDLGSEKALDSGLYSNSFVYEKAITYGAENFEKWTFTVRDKNGKTSAVSLTLTKDSHSVFGQITNFPSVLLGAHLNTLYGHFFSFADGKIYFADSATAKQDKIYLITYFGDILSPPTEFTLSSPGESDASSFYPLMTTWNLPKNEIRYKADSVSISPAEFDASTNDSLIISNYTGSTSGKRKFKAARAGFVIPFQIVSGPLSGKKGLMKVKSVNGTTNGTIELAIKIQK